jgi:SAM-dependent methyltransferase
MMFLRQWYVKSQINQLFFVHDEIRFYDAGAGFCQYSDFILSNWKKSQVLALDLKKDYLEAYADYAKQMFPNRFDWVTADLVTYKPEQKFNLIAAIDILEHIENDTQVLRNFYDCLDEGGKLIISTPSDLDEAARFTDEHVRPGYNPDDIKAKLLAAGFKIVSFKYSYGRWGKISWKLALQTPLKLLAHSKALFILLPFYYLFTYPVIWLLMKKDMQTDNKQGNGLIITAEKPLSAS